MIARHTFSHKRRVEANGTIHILLCSCGGRVYEYFVPNFKTMAPAHVVGWQRQLERWHERFAVEDRA